jgi:cytochrome b6-f complex iron-sulfur subunit
MDQKKKSEKPLKKQDRRNFMSRLSRLIGTLAAFEFLGVTVAYFSSKPRKMNPAIANTLFDAGHTDDFKPGSVTAFAGARFYLVRFKDGGFMALSLRCSHLGCSVNWHEQQECFVCPCHASQYDKSGNVLNPPAPRALDYYPVEIENNIIRVNTARLIKRNSFEKSQVVYG